MLAKIASIFFFIIVAFSTLYIRDVFLPCDRLP